MKPESIQAIRQAYEIEEACIREMKEYIDDEQFGKAVDLLAKATRIGAAGCGHSGIICQHFAHLMCCIERPARFISPAEAVHGATGYLQQGDVMVFASRGGKTKELLPILDICKTKGVSVISITENLDSPLALGADVVVHSATKYLNGHGDVIAGFVVGSNEFITKCRMFGLKDMTGACLSPFDAFLIARGLKTLNIRMERHCQNAMQIANFLHGHPAVAKVYYPGLEDFEGYEIAKKQMKMPGGMLAIELKADRDAVADALNKLQLCTIAVSLGDAETLVEHPATMTHSTYTAEELKAAGISEGLVRISVGLEDAEDIIEDLKSVLDDLV